MSEVDAESCRCGYRFPPKPEAQFAAYPRFGPGATPPNVSNKVDQILRDLAFQHLMWYRRLLIYLVLGFLCAFLWGVCAISVAQLARIRRQVKAQGVEIAWWRQHYRTK